MKPFFVFDLDSTITRCELLPLIAREVGLGDEMTRLTEAAMRGGISFEEDFPKRVELLKRVPVSLAQRIVSDAPLNAEIAGFIRRNPQRCMIVTGNLDAWIDLLIESLGMAGRCLCSKAAVHGDQLLGVATILDKGKAAQNLPRPFVAIGDGSNDVEMLRIADTGIAFGGVRMPGRELIAAADRVIYNETELVTMLEKLL